MQRNGVENNDMNDLSHIEIQTDSTGVKTIHQRWPDTKQRIQVKVEETKKRIKLWKMNWTNCILRKPDWKLKYNGILNCIYFARMDFYFYSSRQFLFFIYYDNIITSFSFKIVVSES